ncbi:MULTISPECIES: N-acyl homoserine lactonase family protein [Nocardia]|uniref:N-acyl homoserine lactonase family protein n=1 Tax=Nocardia TaxID=1817 RepID=UPI0007EACED8|nr:MULTISPECIES: N-acyl homoserine lactonase family protein [Nocardia]MBF6274864.1 N-acyl homoserine lactonase family protein [Nocardia nova]OBA53305.1 N-acyl homoserine lactonase [Nocardia sp. 852002-51101_SCH5132738]OBB29543.1 N-acyl homoserine lactonase [Nocardia sp. 852002-51244_SCH5132740]OBF66095.1 N-acyl homoserine lactonase [Mycobacterium sp. 852002-51759_SCH5129042]
MGATSGSTGTADRGPAGIDKIRLTILPTGTMHGDLTWLLIDPGHMATSADKHPPRDWVEVPTYVVYIEHPDGTKLLWDTGVPRDWEKRWGPTGMDKFFPVDSVTEDMWLDSRLRQLGLEPGDIDYLVLSHLHGDHAGNAQLWAGTRTTIVVDAEEKKGAFGFDGYSNGAYFRPDYDGLELTTIDEDTELLPGVTLLRTPGHTPGTLSLLVDLADTGAMLFSSDSLYRSESYGPPAIAAGIVYDTVAWFQSVEKIRAIADRTGATVVFGHDPGQLAGLKTGVGNYYT